MIAAQDRRLYQKIHQKAGTMNNIHDYYDDITEVSALTKEAIEKLELAKHSVQHALRTIKNLKKHGDIAISPISNVTTNDVQRNLLFFELLLNQTLGVTKTLEFYELLELTSHLTIEGEY